MKCILRMKNFEYKPAIKKKGFPWEKIDLGPIGPKLAPEPRVEYTTRNSVLLLGALLGQKVHHSFQKLKNFYKISCQSVFWVVKYKFRVEIGKFKLADQLAILNFENLQNSLILTIYNDFFSRPILFFFRAYT